MYISPLRFLILEEYVLQQSSNTGLSKLDPLCHKPDLTSPRTDHWVWRGWKLDNHHRVAWIFVCELGGSKVEHMRLGRLL